MKQVRLLLEITVGVLAVKVKVGHDEGRKSGPVRQVVRLAVKLRDIVAHGEGLSGKRVRQSNASTDRT